MSGRFGVGSGDEMDWEGENKKLQEQIQALITSQQEREARLSDEIARAVQEQVAQGIATARRGGNTDGALVAALEDLTKQSADTAKAMQEGAARTPARKSEKIGLVPSKFKGEKSDARRFLTSLRSYLHSNEDTYDTEEKRLGLCFSLMEGKAGQWIEPYMEETLNKPTASIEEDDEENFYMTELKTFLDRFKDMWFSQDEAADARAKMEKLYQGSKTVAEYTAEFSLLTAPTEYDSTYLRERYKKGLSHEIRATIGAWDRDMSTYTKVRDAAFKAESQKEEFTGRRNNQSNPSTTPAASRGNWRSAPSSSSTSSPASDPNAMVVDATAFICYNCYEEGHKAVDCKNAKKPFRRVERRAGQPKKLAATSSHSPSPTTTSQNPSKEAGDASRVAELEKAIEEMNLKMGRMVEMFDVEVAGVKMQEVFTVTDIGTEEVIMGIDWLRNYDPIISFKKGTLEIPQTRKMKAYATTEVGEGVEREVREELLNMEDEEGKKIWEKLPKQYWKYTDLFRKSKAERLPEHSETDHAINLKPDFVPIKAKPYPLSKPQLQALEQWLEEQLRKGYIRPSKSPMSSPFF